MVDDDELRARLGGELEELAATKRRRRRLVTSSAPRPACPSAVVGLRAEVEQLGGEGEDLVAPRSDGRTLPCVGLGVWRSLVARSVRVGEAPSSNLGTPITSVGEPLVPPWAPSLRAEAICRP